MEAKLMIGIEVDGQKLVLDEEKARGLYRMLDGLFGEKIRKEYIPYPVSPPVVYPSYPYYTTSGTVTVNKNQSTWTSLTTSDDPKITFSCTAPLLNEHIL
jgi:hypothetical protein